MQRIYKTCSIMCGLALILAIGAMANGCSGTSDSPQIVRVDDRTGDPLPGSGKRVSTPTGTVTITVPTIGSIKTGNFTATVSTTGSGLVAPWVDYDILDAGGNVVTSSSGWTPSTYPATINVPDHILHTWYQCRARFYS